MAAAGGGGGTGGREIEAGRAYVALGLKDKLSGALGKVKGQLSAFGSELKKSLGGQVDQASGVAARAGILGGAALALREMATNLTTFVPSLTEASREMASLQESASRASFFVERLHRDFERAAEMAAASGGISAELAVIEKQVKAQERLLKLKDEEIERAYELKMAAGDPSTGRTILGSGWIGAITGIDVKEEFDKAQAAYEAIAGGRASLVAKLNELSTKRESIVNPITDPKFVATVDGLSRSMGDALNPKLKEMGEFEKAANEILKANEAANEATKQRLKDLVEEGRLTDKQLKAAEDRARIAGDFAAEMKRVEFSRLTKDLSPEASRLAGLIDKGFSNDQILEIQQLERSLRDRGGTMTKGLGASVNAALSLGVADQWKAQEKLMELTNEKLDELRDRMDGLMKNLAMR